MGKKITKIIQCGNGSFERDIYEGIKDGCICYTDSCVICGADTGVDITVPFSERYNYIDGLGQSCGCIKD